MNKEFNKHLDSEKMCHISLDFKKYNFIFGSSPLIDFENKRILGYRGRKWVIAHMAMQASNNNGRLHECGYVLLEECRYHADKESKDCTEKPDNLQVAYEVIDGRWGNGEKRKADLEKAGYDYREIQALVNEICTPKQKRSILDSIIKLFRIR